MKMVIPGMDFRAFLFYRKLPLINIRLKIKGRPLQNSRILTQIPKVNHVKSTGKVNKIGASARKTKAFLHKLPASYCLGKAR